MSEEQILLLKEKWFSNQPFDFKSPNLVKLVNAYLISSILYYEYDISIMSDYEYDNLCKSLLEKFDEIMSNEFIKQSHKKLLDTDALKAGSGYHIKHYDLDVTGFEHVKLLKWIHDNK